jgi:spoIIIJ-associated protein
MSDQTQTDDESVDQTVDQTDVQTDVQTDAPTEQVEDQLDEAGAEADPQDAVGEAADSPDDADDADDADDEEVLSELEREGDIAADYLEELLDIADLDGDLDMDVDGDRAAVSIVGADLSQLVGQRGEVLDALQELTRLAVYRETGERSRLMLDISGYRADQRARLVELARSSVAQVQETGERVALDPMSPFERKVVHDAVAEAGLTSESEGVEPRRFVVILPV